MSLGALSPEAHEALAIAMNTIGEDQILVRVERILRDITHLKPQRLNRLPQVDLV